MELGYRQGMRAFVRLSAIAAAVLLMAGCYFDQPLTGHASKNLNTWLLGVWESKDESGRVSRIMVTPANESRYLVQVAVPGKTPRTTKRYEFEAWSSKVGSSNFLTLRCIEGSGDVPTGAHVFAHFELLNQNNVRIRGLQLESAPSASSFELRKEVREKLKAGTLYADKMADWRRVEEVTWGKDGESIPFAPVRNPTL